MTSITVASCATVSHKSAIRASAQAEIDPFMKSAAETAKRIPAATGDFATVYLPGGVITEIFAGDLNFSNGVIPDPEVEALRMFIQDKRQVLGVDGNSAVTLTVMNQTRAGRNTFVRFQQSVERGISRGLYRFPIAGATIVARIQDGKLKALNSSLLNPPQNGNWFNAPGFVFKFTFNELSKFLGMIKTNPQASAQVEAMFAVLARAVGRPFDLPTFLNRQISEQLETLNFYFGSIGRLGMMRFMVDMAQQDKLALVRYGSEWRIQITGIFDLPVQFDILFASDTKGLLAIENLRETSHRSVAFHGYLSPYYPSTQDVEGGETADRAVARLKSVAGYFQNHFGWSSYDGQDSQSEVVVHTGLKSLDYIGNAAWLGKAKKFVVGEAGSSLFNLEDSISVLGHEYAHAIIQFSSGLVYRGESGALNEHFADIQGASIEAETANHGEFGYTVGQDVLTPAVRVEKEKLLELIFTNTKYTANEVRDFSLNHVGLRHLYAPVLSFATQYDHVDAARKAYSDECQPSVDNDNCGVHTVSGVPNKAASLIISVLGLEATRGLFFNTLAYRMTQYSNFTDYVIQLFDECRETPELAARCDVVLASFAAVGIQHPTEKMALAPAPQKEKSKAVAPVLGVQGETPELRFCGWVDHRQNDDVRIFDNKYNATMISKNNPTHTEGDYIKIKGYHCGCVTGRVTQTTEVSGKVFNAFTFVSKIEDRGSKCAEDPLIFDKKPPKEPINTDFQMNYHYYCGWVSVNSRSRNIHLIDNRYDVAILASGYNSLTRGDYQPIYRQQCACIHGKVGETVNSKGTVFNYFTAIDRRGVLERSYQDCVGIQWR